MIIKAPTPDRLPDLHRLWQEAFGDDDAFWDQFSSTALDVSRCLAAWNGDALAGALYWFDCTCRDMPVGYVYGVATAKAFRGRGVCHALMDGIHSTLAQRGYAGTILVPASESLFSFYASMGYETFCGLTNLTCAPKGERSVRPVDKLEYASLRRQFLPQGGVVQDGENLDFLATQAQFYAGTDFVLAARKENECLMGLELLGDVCAGSGILTALNCPAGTFRVFGAGRPFAMYRPLTHAPTPTYFALAFD